MLFLCEWEKIVVIRGNKWFTHSDISQSNHSIWDKNQKELKDSLKVAFFFETLEVRWRIITYSNKIRRKNWFVLISELVWPYCELKHQSLNNWYLYLYLESLICRFMHSKERIIVQMNVYKTPPRAKRWMNRKSDCKAPNSEGLLHVISLCDHTCEEVFYLFWFMIQQTWIAHEVMAKWFHFEKWLSCNACGGPKNRPTNLLAMEIKSMANFTTNKFIKKHFNYS